MTQPKSDLAYLRSEKAKAEQQLRYYKYREKILEHQIPELTRKARVHRLCTRAGMLESFLIAPEELTNDQVMELLKISFRQPEVVLALAKMVHFHHPKPRRIALNDLSVTDMPLQSVAEVHNPIFFTSQRHLQILRYYKGLSPARTPILQKQNPRTERSPILCGGTLALWFPSGQLSIF